MKTNISILFLIFMGLHWVQAQDVPCSRVAVFGGTNICLPKIDGYQECYLDPKVKGLADATESHMNSVLGYYLNDYSYSQKENLGATPLGDYFKIYATNQLKDLQVDEVMFKQMQEMLAGNFFSKNWDQMKVEIDKLGLGADLSTPTVVKKYNLNKNSFTYVMLMKVSVAQGDSYLVAFTMNGYMVKQKIIWMAYYMRYKDEETINQIQIQSDKILGKLTQVEK